MFPIDAVLSVVASDASGDCCEVGTIGNEGASGVDVALGAPVLRTTVCQVGGRIGRLRAQTFLDLRKDLPLFASLIAAAGIARTYFIEQLVFCNTNHVVEQRCARWLLSLADRTTSEELELTHEDRSLMLGVRRPAVTLAELRLRDAGAIEYRRGSVRIVDRIRLESLACECYQLTRAAFDESLGEGDPQRSRGVVFKAPDRTPKPYPSLSR